MKSASTTESAKTKTKLKQNEVASKKGHMEDALDEALKESFPASDPIAVTVAKPVNKVTFKSKPIRKRKVNMESNDEKRS